MYILNVVNDGKTEFLLIDTRKQLSKVEPLPLRVGTMDIEPANCVRNLIAWFDSMLSMETHINKVCSSGFYYLQITSEVLENTSHKTV